MLQTNLSTIWSPTNNQLSWIHRIKYKLKFCMIAAIVSRLWVMSPCYFTSARMELYRTTWWAKTKEFKNGVSAAWLGVEAQEGSIKLWTLIMESFLQSKKFIFVRKIKQILNNKSPYSPRSIIKILSDICSTTTSRKKHGFSWSMCLEHSKIFIKILVLLHSRLTYISSSSWLLPWITSTNIRYFIKTLNAQMYSLQAKEF